MLWCSLLRQTEALLSDTCRPFSVPQASYPESARRCGWPWPICVVLFRPDRFSPDQLAFFAAEVRVPTSAVLIFVFCFLPEPWAKNEKTMRLQFACRHQLLPLFFSFFASNPSRNRHSRTQPQQKLPTLELEKHAPQKLLAKSTLN